MSTSLLGKVLKEVQKNPGVPSVELAQKAGINYSTFCSYRNLLNKALVLNESKRTVFDGVKNIALHNPYATASEISLMVDGDVNTVSVYLSHLRAAGLIGRSANKEGTFNAKNFRTDTNYYIQYLVEVLNLIHKGSKSFSNNDVQLLRHAAHGKKSADIAKVMKMSEKKVVESLDKVVLRLQNIQEGKKVTYRAVIQPKFSV